MTKIFLVLVESSCFAVFIIDKNITKHVTFANIFSLLIIFTLKNNSLSVSCWLKLLESRKHASYCRPLDLSMACDVYICRILMCSNCLLTEKNPTKPLFEVFCLCRFIKYKTNKAKHCSVWNNYRKFRLDQSKYFKMFIKVQCFTISDKWCLVIFLVSKIQTSARKIANGTSFFNPVVGHPL